MTITDLPDGPIRVLVSSCLLGDKVRYDGGHKRDPFLVETLGRFVEYVPVCPEVECGLPTPREAMRLAGDPAHPRLVTVKSGVDHTGKMQGWIRRKLQDLEDLDLCGYICKKDSPSSGMERVKVYGETGIPSKVGAGMFTKAFMDHFPLVPVEEEGRLQDPALREMFVERVFTLRRLRDRIRKGKSRGNLVEFHTDHKLLLLTHGRALYAEMGKLVAHAKDLPLEELYGRYLRLLMEALRFRTSPAKCADVLMHMMGHFRQFLTSDEKQELLEVIGRYRNRLIPLVVPVTLIRHYVRKYDVAYLKRQVFLNPHPVELMLRNHV
ncbi:MAG TPA: DUF523 and DUF1722 domain-containing protein [Candidatus Limnocylindrales bacterium]|nr:DUF523 and DUF1722 domain-containing protein [Candidatus Limnocylindrales bacterium]